MTWPLQSLRLRFTSFLLLCLLVLTIGSAQAFWPFGRDDNKPAQAPDPTYRETECEPYKRKAQQVFQGRHWYTQPWSNIRYARLQAKHRQCLSHYRDMEYDYLKDADIKPNPSTP